MYFTIFSDTTSGFALLASAVSFRTQRARSSRGQRQLEFPCSDQMKTLFCSAQQRHPRTCCFSWRLYTLNHKNFIPVLYKNSRVGFYLLQTSQTSSAVNGSRGLCQSSSQKRKKRSLRVEHELEEEDVKPQEVDQKEQVRS